MMCKLTIELNCGERTCASAPGSFCQFLKTRRFGTEWFCKVFDVELGENEAGWLLRCDECLAQSTQAAHENANERSTVDPTHNTTTLPGDSRGHVKYVAQEKKCDNEYKVTFAAWI